MPVTEYIPIPELEIYFRDSELIVSCPWVKITCETDPQSGKKIEALYRQTNLSETSRAELTRFLRNFENYPVFLITPEKVSGEYQPFSHAAISASKLIEDAGKYRSSLTNSDSTCVNKIELTWDVAAALEFSGGATSDFISGPALFTWIRHQRFLLTQKLANLSKLHETTDHAKLREKLTNILRQTFYITSNCQAAIGPARERYSQFRQAVDEFLAEEVGHEALIENSLEHLGCPDPEALQVEPGIALQMLLLRMAADKSFFTLACMVDAFEGIDFTTEKSPLAALIEKLPDGAKAARGVQKHYTINRSGGHGGIALRWARLVPGISKDEARFAIACLELLIRSRYAAFANLVG